MRASRSAAFAHVRLERSANPTPPHHRNHDVSFLAEAEAFGLGVLAPTASVPRASDSFSGDGVRGVSFALRSTIWMWSSRGVFGLRVEPLAPLLALKWPSRSGTDVGEFRARFFADLTAPFLG